MDRGQQGRRLIRQMERDLACVDRTINKFDPTTELPAAINLIKRTFLKVSKKSFDRIAIVVPKESVQKIAAAIDPNGDLYQSIGDFIHFNGVAIVAEESGETGMAEAQAWLKTCGR
jgi:hypothetical protein